MIFFFLLLHLISIVQLSHIFSKEIVESQQAKCLDGSPSILYIHPGNPKKILLHFQSGGWCGEPSLSQTLQSCYQRSLTSLGSSKYSPPTLTFSSGILSDNQPNYFTNWTLVFLGYCDGAGHQGSRYQPIKYKNKLLYFRGNEITIERFEYLQHHYGLFSQTEEVVLSGASAGGLATYFWGNYLKQRLNHQNYFIIPDSGIFLNSPDFSTQKNNYLESLKNLFSLSNSDIDPPTPQCLSVYPNERYFCLLAQNIIQYVSVPMFSVQSLYDAWSIENILGIKCALKYSLTNCSQRERAFIEEYRYNTTQVMKKVKQLDVKNGFWANGCVYHGYTYFSSYNSPKFRIPSDTPNSIDFSLSNWSAGSLNMYFEDEKEWPGNEACSNKQTDSVQR